MSDDQEQQQEAPPRKLQFRSPVHINDVDGYVLAMILRLVTTQKTYHERTMMDGVSVLTLENMEDVVPLFAYFKTKMAEHGVRTRAQFDDVVSEWGGLASIDQWCDDHRQEVSQARRHLGELFDAPNRPGFSCYDG